MNILAHLFSVLLAARHLNLSSSDMALAVIFGVLLDADHILKLPLYYSLPKSKRKRHFNWRTPLQEPVSLLWIVPLSIYLQTMVPVLFFILHLALDYLMSYPKKPFFPYSNFSLKPTQKLKRDLAFEIIFTVVLCIFLVV
ncbi:hypothetical protein D6764_01415 [Candidatus Woesearchaeota archaeon]|nr:MAG: hypothetical protein D6764_01415 [Candidatus Woesearchaeota archaeon]